MSESEQVGQLRELNIDDLNEKLRTIQRLFDLAFASSSSSSSSSENTVITNADSPYTALDSDEVIICDTNTGGVTVNVSDAEKHTIANWGGSNNQVIVIPQNNETIFGDLSAVLENNEIIDIHRNPGKGWI
jgi:hypothetical protein